jgi:hypothetical protein
MKKITENHSMSKPAAKPPAKTAAKPAAKAKAKTTPSAVKKKPVGASAAATVISVEIDVGLGNHLYIRGSGPSLDWDRGLAMECVGAGLWAITLEEATHPIPFKVLLNDSVWSKGDDFVAEPGTTTRIVPSF